MAEVTYVQRRRFRWEQAEIELIRYTLTGGTADIVVGFKAEYVLTTPIDDTVPHTVTLTAGSRTVTITGTDTKSGFALIVGEA